ncbi:hypothetical protein D3C81_2097020 [compost metagenome]
MRARAPGSKSSMLWKVMSTLSRLPSSFRVFSTWKAARGLSDFMRSSKLSMSISRKRRSASAAGASTGLPSRSAMTPMTKGSWIFFSEP